MKSIISLIFVLLFTFATVFQTPPAYALQVEGRMSEVDDTPPEPPAPPVVWQPLDVIPLSADMQMQLHAACERHGVPLSLALAIIQKESTFNPKAKNQKCFGLFQIHQINYTWLRASGIEPTAYTGNIDAGVMMIGGLLVKYGDVHKALMAYNCGEGGAKKLWKRGTYTTSYSRSVVKYAQQWEEKLKLA